MAIIHGRVGRGDPMGATLVAGGIGFRTWAPSASSVAVVAGVGLPGSIAQVGWRPAAGDMLQPLGDGSWGGVLPGAGDGTPYLFFVIGPAGARWKRDPYARELTFTPPYPASYCLARSPDSYPWRDRDWRPPAFSDMILYQLHVGTWWAVDQAGTDVRATRGGTFLDVASRVEYLDGLGINVVQLMPIQEFETPHSLGYNGTDLFSPEMRYCCTLEEVRWRLPQVNAALARHGATPLTEAQLLPGINQLKLLVDLLHLAGIGIVFDLVFNHAFGHDRRGSFDGDSLWFYDQQVGPDPNRSLYFTDRVWIGPVFAYWQDWVCQFLIDNACSMVTEFHADGLRYDEISAVVNMGGDSGVTFAQRLSGTVRATRGSASGVAVSYCLDGCIQHRVDQFSIWMRPNGPAGDQAIEAVNDGREVNLAGWDLKLGDFGQPLLVRGCCPEVAIDEGFGRRTDLPQIGAVPAPLRFGDNQALLFHQPLHHLFRDRDALPDQRSL